MWFDPQSDHGNSSRDSETHVPQTLVIAAFLAIFLAQVGINLLRVVRERRRRRAVVQQMQVPVLQRERERVPDHRGDGAAEGV